ncbi:ATP-binding protein [Blastochloris tepida]|nr:ATP-binding protein [Blastochloris tepida]
MSFRDQSDAADFAGLDLPGRLVAARRILAAAALAAAGGVALGGLDPLVAVAGFALVTAAAALPGRRRLGPAAILRPPAPNGRLQNGRARDERVQDDRLGHLVAALPEPAMLVDRRARVLAANSRVEVAIGPARIGEPLTLTLRVPEVLEAVRAVAGGAAARRVEFQARIPVDRWYEAHVAPVRFSAEEAAAPGLPDVVLVLLRDLTQQRRLEQMRADFVANASHELRTPLASLSGFIETIQGPARNDTAARERFLVIMAEQAKRMSRLIDDLLSLSRIELNLHIRPDTRVDLVHVLREVMDALAPLALDRGIELRLAEQAAALPVQGDRDELIRVFENLVENALKYGGSERGVDVVCAEAAREDGSREAVVSVIDYGPGIAPEHLPRLTERFYRVDVPRSREQGGTGLGLAIVKHIVNRHRGRLSIASEAGKGTIFAVRMGLAQVLPESEKIDRSMS